MIGWAEIDQIMAIVANAQRRARQAKPVHTIWLQCFRPDDARAVEIAGRWIVNPTVSLTVANAKPRA